jgi:alpha-methylacyl-CoA racemase
MSAPNGRSSGPLTGVRVMEFAALGPAPFATMLLSDLGAEVLRIDRIGGNTSARDVLARGRSSLAVDLKTPQGIEQCLSLMSCADVVIEGFRPGVMERLGLGPEVALANNPRLIYGRMTGWGQVGPLAKAAGHDINYIAITGALAGIGPADGVPIPPLNLVGDFGGGSLYLALGIVAALFERERSGCGQVIDAAIVDGVASQMALFNSLAAEGQPLRRGTTIVDGSAHYYRCYACADGRHIAVGAIEPHFYKLLLDLAGVPERARVSQAPADWQQGTVALAELFKTKTRQEWCTLLEGTDACFAPVLELDEAPLHRHNAERSVFVEEFGVVQPAPAPRFSRTPGRIQGPPPAPGEGGAELAARWRTSHAE